MKDEKDVGGQTISPWQIALYVAFGSTEPVPELHPRSFDQGKVRLPDDTDESHTSRVEKHDRFDDAEARVMAALASGRLKATGAPPVVDRHGRTTRNPSRERREIPSVIFSNNELALGEAGDLQSRVDTLGAVVPAYELRDTAEDPYIPLFFDVRIDLTAAREVFAHKDTANNQAVVGAQQLVKQQAKKPGPKSRGDEMREALIALLGGGERFKTLKAAHSAVIKALNASESGKGLSPQTFAEHCSDLLRSSAGGETSPEN